MVSPPSASSVTLIAQHTLQCAKEIPSSSIGKLGPFDQLVVPFVPTSIVFVYRQNDSTPPIDLHRLKRALDLLLDYFPHLTGRLHIDPTSGGYEITHLNTGAALFVAQCSRTLDSFSSSPGRIMMSELPAAGNALLPPFDGSVEGVSRDSLFAIQHTRFVCGGVSLGVRLNHVVCDGEGFFQLIRDLAELYRGLAFAEESKTCGAVIPELAHPPQIVAYMSDLDMTPQEKIEALAFEPSILQLVEQVTASDISAASPATPPPAPIIGRILRFSESQLYSLKSHATDSNNPTSWISTFDALAALLYQRIYQARLQSVAGDFTALSAPDFLTPVNFRAPNRLPGLPASYFPNALLCCYTSLSPSTLTTAPLHQIAQHLHDMTRAHVPTAEHIRQTLRWVSAQPVKGRIETGFRYGNGSLMVSQWAKFDMYEAAQFERDVLPVIVGPPFTPIILMDGLAYTLPGQALGQEVWDAKDGAVDVALSLTQPVWDGLDKDAEFGRYCTIQSEVRPEDIA